MAELTNLNNPWLVAVWPGMGSVAMLAGGHLSSELGAEVVGELDVSEFFDVQQIDVRDGLARTGRPPRHMFLLWRDPQQRRDVIVFIAEAQPQRGGYDLCRKLIERARQWNVQRVVTFAAMATQLRPADQARVFAVGTSEALLNECRRIDLELLREGQVSGLNGTVLAAAAEQDIDGLCLMGEMPYFAMQAPNPAASLAALEAFCSLADIHLDLSDLRSQAEQVNAQLQQLVERLGADEDSDESDLGFTIPDVARDAPQETDEPKQPPLSDEARQRIEALFDEVHRDRAKAVTLKKELDRHGVFDQYEDRFLDLFRKGG